MCWGVHFTKNFKGKVSPFKEGGVSKICTGLKVCERFEVA